MNLTPCEGHADLNDSNGEYLKSVCMMREEVDFETALKHCHDMGMQLFDIHSAEENKALFDYAYQMGFLLNLGPAFWTHYDGVECSGTTPYEKSFMQFDSSCASRHSFVCQYEPQTPADSPGQAERLRFNVMTKLLLLSLAMRFAV